MRRGVLFAVCLLAFVSLKSVALAAPSAELPAGPIGRHLAAYVSAVNDPADAADAFGVSDLSPAFKQRPSPAALARYFNSQRRVTGGISPIGFRFDKGSSSTGQFAFRDTIYGGVRAITLEFDDTVERRIVNFSPVPAPVWAIPSMPKQTPAEIAEYASALIDRGCRADVFSGVFLVAFQGQVLVERSCGEADKRNHIANTPSTRINLGSINKIFTAVAVAQLIEQGRMSPTDRLSKFVDESWLPSSVSTQITIRQLLAMTSGLGSYFDGGPVSRFQMNRTLDAYKPVIRAQTLLAAPGEKFIYSDTGYFLLGLAVQKASGDDYYGYVRDHVYAPAGMVETGSFELSDPAEPLAYGYEFASDKSRWRENRAWAIERGGPDGGGYSTARDLLRFAEALKAGKLVSQASLQRLWSDQPPNSWGEGFYVLASPAGRIVGKDGFGSGISSEIDIYLDQGFVVVALSNYGSGALAPMDAMRAKLALPPRVQPTD